MFLSALFQSQNSRFYFLRFIFPEVEPEAFQVSGFFSG